MAQAFQTYCTVFSDQFGSYSRNDTILQIWFICIYFLIEKTSPQINNYNKKFNLLLIL
jgi:hypothetical protein